MRRILCVILLGGLLLTMLSGCTSREPSPESGSESRTASASEPLSPEDPSMRRCSGHWAPKKPRTDCLWQPPVPCSP